MGLRPAKSHEKLPAVVARALVPVSMGPGGGPTKMYESPRVSRPLPLIWGWVFDAAAPALVPALGALPPTSTRRAFSTLSGEASRTVPLVAAGQNHVHCVAVTVLHDLGGRHEFCRRLARIHRGGETALLRLDPFLQVLFGNDDGELDGAVCRIEVDLRPIGRRRFALQHGLN